MAIGGLALAAAACGGDDPTPTPATDQSEVLPLAPNPGGPDPTVPPNGQNSEYASVEVLAPIDSVNVLIAESFPPQYFVEVVSGLPSGCAEFNGHDVARDGTTIRITVNNLEPASEALVLCTAIYGMHQSNVALGSDFESGTEYTVHVNDATETFVAQ